MRCWVVMGLTVVSLMGGAVHGKDFVIGQSLDLSGLSNLGKDFSNGVRTYFDAINARGGVRSTVKSVLERFEKKPYGWYYAAIICNVALLCARGKLEVRMESNVLEDEDL